MDLGATRVLGNWQPELHSLESKKFLVTRLSEEIERILQATLVFDHDDTRGPSWKPQDKTAVGFHQDGSTRDGKGKKMYMILWSNVCPTEVKLDDGSILPVKDGDIILLKNDEVYHRTPEEVTKLGAAALNRWFIRFWNVKGIPLTS